MSAESSPTNSSVAVIGGGLVGLASALALQGDGYQVVVIDPMDPHARASYGNAGVISPGSIFPMSGPAIWRALPGYLGNRSAAVRLRYRDTPAMMSWGLRFLGAATGRARSRAAEQLAALVSQAIAHHHRFAVDLGTTDWLNDKGWLRLYRSASAFEAAAPELALLRRHGVRVDILDDEQIQELEPCLGTHFMRAQFFPDALSMMQPGRLLERAYQCLRERGGQTRQTRVTGLVQLDSKVAIATTDGPVHADYAVLAAGAWSGTLARRLGYRIPMIAERGYHQSLAQAPGTPALTRPVNDVAGGYVASPDPVGVRLLTGVELARPDSPPDYAQMAAARTVATPVLGLCTQQPPSMAVHDSGDGVNAVWMGSRPSTPDGLPVIGRAERHSRILFAFGHGHIGFSTAPLTGRLIADLLAGRPLPVPLEAFAPGRFQR